jgi:hypothetical protein
MVLGMKVLLGLQLSTLTNIHVKYYSNNIVDSMAPGYGNRPHYWRIHPHPARYSNNSRSAKSYTRAKSSLGFQD